MLRFARAVGGFIIAIGVIHAQLPSPPTILSHPASTQVFIGDSVTLTAGVSGASPLSFQWHKNSVAISGATNASLSLPAVALADSGLYHLVATNAGGSALTTPAYIEVLKRPQSVTLTPVATLAVSGSSIVLDATSSASLPVTLALVSGVGSLNGNRLTSPGGNVTVRATQPGNATFAPAEPVERTYTFVTGMVSPYVTSPPADQTVRAGTPVAFRAAAIGTPAPVYQWSKDGAALPGATRSTLTLPPVTLADAGTYSLVASNLSGSASASARLTVEAAPVITGEPASQAVFSGETATFSVAVTGVPAPSYQWRKNGAPLAGATRPSLAFARVSAADAGRYDVAVTNPLGGVTSAPATLVVTVRDFTGTYFGSFAGAGGDFALHVRPNGRGVLLASVPSPGAALVIPNLAIDAAGNFSVNATAAAATPQAVTLSGRIDDQTGTVRGTVAPAGVTFDGRRGERTGSLDAVAGYYPAAFLGSTAHRGHVIVASDGRALFVSIDGGSTQGAAGTVDDSGRFVATTNTQAAVDLAFAGGSVRGSLRSGGGTQTLLGAVEGRTGSEHVANLSVRSATGGGAATLITGFVITGTAAKQVLIRAAGPALGVAPFNISNVVADPTLQVLRGTTSVGQNDDWGTPAANANAITAAATRAGAFPFRAGSQDAALLMSLAPGAYTVVMGGGNGTTLAEIYEVLANNEAAGARRLVNVSARALVAPTSPFIAGFVISGAAPQRVLIRAVGPRLANAPFNVAGALANPQLTLFRGATAIRSNDDWFRDADAGAIRDAAARAGAFALGANSLDAAMLLFLEPGAYTAQITPPANATGVALIEIYEAPP